jgi:Putative DNA-binding domain
MLLDYPTDELQPNFAAVFAQGLTDPARATPADVVGPRGKAAIKRYNVYRNNVTVSLINALADTYPAVQRITGVEFFRAMARFHVRATPPTSPLLFEYGRDFPAFIEGYEHARDMPWLADTARIERAWLDAYHAADVPPLSPDALAAVPSDRLGDLVFTTHPATRIMRSEYPAVAIFAMNRVEGPVTPLQSNAAEDALITRPDMEVAVRLLPPGGAAFLMCLIRRRNVGRGCHHGFCRNVLLRPPGSQAS